MARARRPEARGDPPIAISSCSNFAARPAGVKLRARLPSRRVAAHNLPRHRLALSGRGRSGVGPAEVMGPCGRGAPPPQSPAPTRPIRPPGTRTHAPYSQLSSLDHGPPSAAAPRPAGDAMTVEHRERARTRRSLHDADARARRGARGARRPAPHAPQSSASPDRLRPRVAWCTALISTAACAQALEGSGDVWPHRVQGKRR